MNRGITLGILSAVAAVILVILLRTSPQPVRAPGQALLVYCAAGIKPPVESVARAYEEECHVSIQLQYGGSGTLLSNLRVAQKGDLFLAADESYLLSARSNHLVQEIIPLSVVILRGAF
jgi:molybdate transport system substrate-binding protein